MQTLRASPAFALAVLITLALAGLNGLMVLLMQLRPGFMGMAHFTEHHHRVHDLTFGFLFLPVLVGALAQLRRPTRNVGGQAMALVPWIGLLLALVLTPTASRGGLGNLAWVAPAATTLVAALLHPAGRGFFRSFGRARVSWVLLGLVVVAAVPLLALASTNVWLQGAVPDDHAQLGHYGYMAAFGFTVVGLGLVASLRPGGWRLVAWVAGLVPVLLGIASLAYPDVSSSLGVLWSLAAIAWGAGFVAAAELVHRTAPLPESVADAAPAATPRWLTAAGIAVLVLVVVVVGMFVTGSSPGGLVGHAPPAGGH
jgi:hypothetical protein